MSIVKGPSETLAFSVCWKFTVLAQRSVWEAGEVENHSPRDEGGPFRLKERVALVC